MDKMKIGDFISYEQPTDYIVHSDQYVENGQVPVLTAGQSFILGYTDEADGIYNYGPVVIFDDFTTSVKYVDFPFKVKSSAMKILKNNENANIKYCYYLLLWLQKMPPNHKRQWISTTSQIDINLPSLEEQKSIIEKIETVSRIINERQQELDKLDELIKARFVEMFGNPVSNPMRWDKEPLARNATLLNGRAYKQDELLDEGKYPVLRVGNFFSNRGWYYSDLELDEDKYCDNGDLLYAWSASFGPKIWDGGKVIYHYHIWKVLVSSAYDKEFLCKLLEYTTESLMGDTHGIGMMHLTKSGMEETEFIIPPIEQQKQFATFVKQVDKSKVVVQKALDEVQLLFDSLMQEYFG